MRKHLGQTIDIHGGGQDLIFPHHENEIAQSTCSHGGKTFCRYWIHNGFVNVNHEKMSKSIGNVLLVHDLLEDAPGEAIRYALLSSHYRSPLDWTDDLLSSAKSSLDRLYGALEQLGDVSPIPCDASMTQAFKLALSDDLNTPLAMSELHSLAKQANVSQEAQEQSKLKYALLECGKLIGLLQQPPSEWFAAGALDADHAAIDALIERRNQARADKDFATADSIRDQLAAMNIEILDSAEGTRWRKK